MLLVWSSNASPAMQALSAAFVLVQVAPYLNSTNIWGVLLGIALAGLFAYGLTLPSQGIVDRIRREVRRGYNSLPPWHRALFSPLFPPRWKQESAQKRMHQIVDRVSKLPIEEFVPDDQLQDCRVAVLRRMLHVRSANNNGGTNRATMNTATPSFVEKSDLCAAVRARRNYNESCCICCEDYAVGDPLRVLPKCRHEFHVECLDQWAFTFANNPRKRRYEPTCPLCNATL